MKEFTYIVKSKNGIHARPAGKIASLAKGFESNIKIYNNEKEADAKRLLSIMGLGAVYGTELIFKIEGNDEEMAQNELLALLNIIEGQD